MLITTTSVIEGAKITRYYGIVSGNNYRRQCIP